MGDHDSKSSFFTSLPGILSGAAALIAAISGLSLWNHKQSQKPVEPHRTVIVEPQRPGGGTEPSAGGNSGQQPQANPGMQTQVAAQSAVNTAEHGSRQWCDQEVAQWSAKMAQGTDDAGIRKAFREGKCGQYGLRLGQPQAKQ